MHYLDDTALAILAKLVGPAEGAMLCPACLIDTIPIGRWELMKSIRALILAGRILCLYKPCSSCGKTDLVVAVRRERFSN
jgi:hypothetical protein